MTTGSACAIRPARAGDVPDLVALEQACFGRPWTAAQLHEEIRRSASWVVVAAAFGPGAPRPPGAAAPGTVLGYACVQLAGEQAELLRIATRRESRRRGVGRDLLCATCAAARDAGCRELLLEVAARNLAARALYDRAGFQVVGTRRAYYRHPPDDAILMRGDASALASNLLAR